MSNRLESYRRKLKDLQAMEARLDELHAEMNGRIIGKYSLTAVSRSDSARGLESRVIRYVAAADDYCKAIGDLAEERGGIETDLDHIPDDVAREVARCYFISGMSKETISETMNYTPRHVARLLQQVTGYLESENGNSTEKSGGT